MRYLTMPAAFVCILFLAGCPSGIEGYDDLTLPPVEQARKDVLDAGALWRPTQIVLEQAVTEPTISDSLKQQIQTADREITAALNAYRESVAAGDDSTTAKFRAFIDLLSRAQALLIDAQTEGVI